MSKASKPSSMADANQSLNRSLIILFLLTTAAFLYWGLNYTQFNHITLFFLAAVFGLFMAFNIGGNDVANSFGTSVGAGTLTIPQALAVAAVFEVSGAVLAGGHVTDTIRKGIVDLSVIDVEPLAFVLIMMAALISAALWLLFATRRGWPVSTTHSIIGGIVGASIALAFVLPDADALALVQWSKIGQIVASWVLSPLLGGLMSFTVFRLIRKYILIYKPGKHDHDDYARRVKNIRPSFHRNMSKQIVAMRNMLQVEPVETPLDKEEKKHQDEQAFAAMQRWAPVLAALGGMMIVAMLLLKGLKNLQLGFSGFEKTMLILMFGMVIWMLVYSFIKRMKRKKLRRQVYILFSWMQVFTASAFAFSHGSNDIANAIGPFVAILDALRNNAISTAAPVPTMAMVAFGMAMVAGLWFIGKEVIATVGTHLAEMNPASGFTAELSAAIVVLLASVFGLPVSSTHILVGAVLGIGLANRNANWALMKPIAAAWVITVPAAALIAALCFLFGYQFI
ncbi:inorganic phosphate transporter [Suttonella sp. R2A3]|uniref:inorganic phosphate transporter n=1 Tax=Suttonella sp. R2A3 TaxID=2908648 RepID=UPI001F22015F|nr:inorganic phosphate transporter [Suttonella sp. R2A3]UJF25196.1 inorganic phosphate transporter [Suttonella sp. R2A3]